MLSFTKKTVELACRLGRLKSPPTPAEGLRSPSRSYTIHNDGRYALGFWWTDGRTTFYSKLPLRGSDENNWIMSVTANNKAMRYLNYMQEDISNRYHQSLDRIMECLYEIMSSPYPTNSDTDVIVWTGASVAELTVDPINIPTTEAENRIKCCLNYKNFKSIFYGYNSDSSLLNMLNELGPQTKININTFTKTLQFVAKGTKSKNRQDRRQTCTMFQDGYSMGADARKEFEKRAVVFVAKGETLPFDITLQKEDAQTLLRWLDIVTWDCGHNVRELDVIDLTDTSRPHYCFCVSEKHYLWLPKSEMPFHREIVGRFLDITPDFAICVNRDHLSVVARVAVKQKLGGVRCRFIPGLQNKGSLEFNVGNENDMLIRNCVKVTQHGAAQEWSFNMYPLTLLHAMKRLKKTTLNNIFLCHIPYDRMLVVCSASDAATYWNDINPKAYMQIITRPSPPETSMEDAVDSTGHKEAILDGNSV